MKTLELELKKKVFIVDTTAPIEAIEIDGYEFLCKGSELTEEIASELVDETIMYEKHKVKCYRYRSYREGFVAFDNAKESFISAVESKEKFWLENPIPEPEIQGGYAEDGSFIGGYDDNWIKEWQEAEEKTFRNPLIFVKNYVQ